MTTTEQPTTTFRGRLLRPHDPDYDDARRIWNGAVDRRPAFIARCSSSADVQEMVRFARRHGLEIAVRGGGHSIPGHSTCDGGLVIDLSEMRAIDVAADRCVAQVGPGATWHDLDAATEPHGLAVPGGEISDTGVAGLTLGGGIGWLSRTFGLSCDNLIGVQLVTVDAEIREVDDASDPDLMWALRGGGGNFGIVTRFDYRLNPIPVPMYAGMVLHPLEDGAAALEGFVELAATVPDSVGLNAALVTAPPAPFVPTHLQGRPVAILAGCCVGPVEEGRAALRDLRAIGAPAVDTFGPMPYTALQSMVDDAVPWGMSSYARSEWLGPVDRTAIDHLVQAAADMTSPLSQVLLRVMGGRIAEVDPGATAFRYREATAMLTVAAMWPDVTDPGEEHTAWTRRTWESLLPWSVGGGYVNHLGDEGAERLRQAYGPDTWDRLTRVKRRMDPANLLHLNQNIPPAPGTDGAPR